VNKSLRRSPQQFQPATGGRDGIPESQGAEIADINATTWDSLKASLQEGLSAGETMEQLAGRVKDTFQAAAMAGPRPLR